MWILEDFNQVSHPVKRMFFISPESETTRGDHAHLDCWQTLVCIKGKILITVDDGIEKRAIILGHRNTVSARSYRQAPGHRVPAS